MAENHLDYAGRRLRLVGTRLVEPEQPGGHVHVVHGAEHETGGTVKLSNEKRSRIPPVFAKTDSATNFELFYDLWFVANLNVFTSIHDISDIERFRSFIGFMVLLWTTWLITTLYDVRYTADSVLERCCKAIHLGVMVGFAEIGTSFNPDEQIVEVFRTMSLFLAVSRFVLFIQYGVVAYQVRKYVDGRGSLFITALLHLVTALVYFGISFRYNLGHSSRVFVVWYVGGVVEMGLHLGLSQAHSVLTFLGTHLGERLNLLTLVILGEGVIILTKSVTLIVKDTYVKDTQFTTWSPALIGIATASCALIYIIFQLYFDWMHEEHSMSKRHQVWWASIHLPFHIALTLLLEGANQFFVWARVLESISAAIDKVVKGQYSLPENPTSKEVSKMLEDVIYPFLEKYQPTNVLETWESVKELLAEISDIPDSFWSSSEPDADTYEHFRQDVTELIYTMVNAIYAAFGIEAPEESEHEGYTSEHMQTAASASIGRRFVLVFIYSFACAGIVLLFLTVMHAISKRKGWSPFNIFRTAFCLLIAVGLGLLTTIASKSDAVLHDQGAARFIGSTWMLPTITICYFVVLIMTHFPHPSRFGLGNFKKGAYTEVEKQNDAKETRPLRRVSRHLDHESSTRHHVADFENRRTGYSPVEDDTTTSPPIPGRDQRRVSHTPRRPNSRQNAYD
ncbi:hypothetical protein F5B20DRAFT_474933 [Whalleya microplaca]|nr:hypothetical protein F5B20DRAFT_474933 [Whalleya microplaca]